MRCLALLVLLMLSTPGYAASLDVVKGDVMVDGKILTTSHDVTDAAASPDGGSIAYLRRPSGRESELWLMTGHGGTPRRIFAGRPDGDPKRDTAELNAVVFALGGDAVFVLATAWAVSNAVHEIRLADGSARFVIDGNDLQVAEQGLLVQRHTYLPQGGSVDDIWLVTPAGKVVRRLGADMAEARRHLRK